MIEISDETWKRALTSAANQFEMYVRLSGALSTPTKRMAALDDALQHAVGLIRLAEMQERRKLLGDPREKVVIG